MVNLGDSVDPRELIPGQAWVVEEDARAVRVRAVAYEEAARGLRRIDAGAWIGAAGDAFRDEFSYEPRRWFAAADAFTAAVRALDSYADMVRWAQDQAQDAIDLWERALAVPAPPSAPVSPVTGMAWGRLLPEPVGPADPAVEMRAQAQHLLDSARVALDNAGDDAGRAIAEAADLAPDKSRWGAFFGGIADAAGFVGGVGHGLWDGFAGTAEFLWELSPVHLLDDPGHYGEVWDSLVDAAKFAWDEPVEFGKAMVNWDLWASDPGRAFGNTLFGFIPFVGVAAKVKTFRRLSEAAPSGTPSGGRTSGNGDSDAASPTDSTDRDADTGGGGSDHPPERRLPDDFVPSEWARGGDVPTNGPEADLFPENYRRYGELSEREFFEKYWDPDARDGQGGWLYPEEPRDGFAGPARAHALEPGDVIDRFGDADGKYASPRGTAFDQRALPPSNLGSDYTQWRVLKPLPDSIREGDVAPWFEQPGGGMQYKFDRDISWYEENGYLERMTPQ